MKNNQNLVSFSPEKGVYLYFADSKMTDIIDIDVEPGIRSIVLSGPNANRNRLSRNVKLRNIFKQFPDVEELVIQEDIMDIDISNFMFPNVRNVDSNNPYFLSCQYLVRLIVVNKILKNVFCIKPDEQIQPLYDINIIDDYAFEGCQLASFFNNDTSFNTIHTINHHAFDGSSFFDIPSKNGLKRVGNIVFGVDDDAEEIEFPEGTKCVLPTDIDYKNVKRAVIRNIKNVNGINKLPETIVVADTEFSKNNMFGIYRYLNTTNVSCIEASPSSGFVSKDGILYSGDMSCLILCPIKKTGDIIVPEGVSPVKKLIVGDNEFIVPASLSYKTLYRLNQQCSSGYFCKSDLHDLYYGAISTELKQDTAYYIYKQSPGADAKLEKYLRRCAKQIALRYIKENKDDEFAEFIGFKLLSKAAIKQLLQVANEADKPSIVAYLLTQTQDKPSSKFTL